MDERVWRVRLESAFGGRVFIRQQSVLIRTRTFFELLDALECDLELERVQKRRGIIENGDVRQLNLGHGVFDEFSRCFYQQQIRFQRTPRG